MENSIYKLVKIICYSLVHPLYNKLDMLVYLSAFPTTMQQLSQM